MKKRIVSSFAAIAAALLVSAPVAMAAPLLYVYEGAGCTGLASLPQFENFLDRKVDGVVDFDDYTSTWANAVSAAKWGMGCWKGQVGNVALAVPLSVATYTPTSGSTQLADIAAGKLDTYFRTLAQTLVANGFPNAQIRLGWEENGNWYLWNAYQSEPNWQAAFAHVYQVMKSVSPTFTIWFNPGQGQSQTQPNEDFPGLGVEDGVAWDVYASTWLSGGATIEPALYNGQYGATWGIKSVGTYLSNLPTAVPEFGVGSRSDGHGTCTGTGVNDCDDPTFMADALAYFAKAGATFVGYWDVDIGGYNAKISDGSRPQQALAFLQVYGGGNLPTLLAGATAYTGSAYAPTPPTGEFQILAQLANGHVEQLVWGPNAGQTMTATDLGAAATPAVPAAAPAAAPAVPAFTVSSPAQTVTSTLQATVTTTPNGNGAYTLNISFPASTQSVTYTINLSTPMRLGFGDGAGGLSGGFWPAQAAWTSFTWASTGGTAQVYAAPPSGQTVSSLTATSPPVPITQTDQLVTSTTPNGDGTYTLTMTFPTTPTGVTYTINLSSPAQLAFSNGAGGRYGGFWPAKSNWTSFTWGPVTGGQAQVYAAPVQ